MFRVSWGCVAVQWFIQRVDSILRTFQCNSQTSSTPRYGKDDKQFHVLQILRYYHTLFLNSRLLWITGCCYGCSLDHWIGLDFWRAVSYYTDSLKSEVTFAMSASRPCPVAEKKFLLQERLWWIFLIFLLIHTESIKLFNGWTGPSKKEKESGNRAEKATEICRKVKEMDMKWPPKKTRYGR